MYEPWISSRAGVSFAGRSIGTFLELNLHTRGLDNSYDTRTDVVYVVLLAVHLLQKCIFIYD